MATGTVEVSNGPTATQLVTAGDGPCSITNGSSTDTIFLGDTNAIRPTDPSDVIPLGPGAATSVDGKSNLFAVPGGSNQVAAYILKGGVATAGEISVNGDVIINGQSGPLDINGVGGFVLPGKLALVTKNVANVVANAGIINLIGPFDVSNYSSITFTANQVTPSSTANGAAICALWQFIWSDGSGTQIGIDTFSVLVGAACTVSVPVKGASVQLAFTNNGSVGTLTYFAGSIAMWGDYRSADEIKVVEYGILGVPTITGYTVLTPSTPQGTSTWIAALNNSTAAANTQFLLPLSLWRGVVDGWYQQTGQALAHDATIVDLTYATQGNIAAGTAYAFGILQNLPLAIQAAPVDITYNSPITQAAFLFETGASVGSTFLMLTGD